MTSSFRAALAATCLLLGSTGLTAQGASPPPRVDSAMKDTMSDHVMGAWKEMNAFHTVLAATWHPVEQNDDLSPLRERVKDLAAAAEALGSSKAPAMPRSCGADTTRVTVSIVVTDSRALAALVESGASDARLKDALKALHDRFEIAEKACAGQGDYQ